MQTNGILVVDKPAGITSHDVVARIRRVFQQKRVGHTGTLDPMATGIVVVVLGEATKLVPLLMRGKKRYQAEIFFGEQTDTLDALGRVEMRCAVPPMTLQQIAQKACTFIGLQPQVPPVFSAIKVRGQAAYKYARKGLATEMTPRPVELHQVQVQRYADCRAQIEIECGKGFYVRSFARDLAQRLGTCGHLTGLRRCANGQLTLSQACQWDVLQQPNASRLVEENLLSFKSACSMFSGVKLNSAGFEDAKHGRSVSLDDASLSNGAPHDEQLVLWYQDQPLALATQQGSHLRIVRGLNYMST